MTGEITDDDMACPRVVRLSERICGVCKLPLGVGLYEARIRRVRPFRCLRKRRVTSLYHARCAGDPAGDEIGRRDEPLCRGK